jgi:glycosyltransferase involved in cell wall biosynthesis
LTQEYVYETKKIDNQNFLYISNYIKEKGIFELLDVFNKLPLLNLECFGEFVNNENEIRKYEKHNIKINRFINGEAKYQKIYESDALILPSWNEGQPTIILEAMMAGTIVLTTKVGLIDELLGDKYPFYFDPKNVDSLKQCIEKFLSYDKKYELSEMLKKEYFNTYSKATHEKKLLKIFGE